MAPEGTYIRTEYTYNMDLPLEVKICDQLVDQTSEMGYVNSLFKVTFKKTQVKIT